MQLPKILFYVNDRRTNESCATRWQDRLVCQTNKFNLWKLTQRLTKQSTEKKNKKKTKQDIPYPISHNHSFHTCNTVLKRVGKSEEKNPSCKIVLNCNLRSSEQHMQNISAQLVNKKRFICETALVKLSDGIKPTLQFVRIFSHWVKCWGWIIQCGHGQQIS